MKPKKKILVLTDQMPWGHRSIARAIYGYLKDLPEFEVKLVESKMAPTYAALNEIYVLMYRFLPLSNRITNRLMEIKRLRKLVQEMLVIDKPKVVKIVDKFKPDLIISSYFLHSYSLVKYRQEKNKKFIIWSVVPGPWTMNPVSFVPGADKQLVYDERGIEEGVKWGIPTETIAKTGWWVRPDMYLASSKSQKDKFQIKRRLGIGDDRPVVFVGGGSLGTSAMLKLLPALMLIRRKVALIFNSGTDKLAFRLVDQYAKLYGTVRKNSPVQIINLGWIENMAEILAICDIVFGKAGPNFLFDCVAARKPFVSISHIGGQEDGNVELLMKKKLGWKREKGNSAAKFLIKFLKNPEKYKEKFKTSIAQEARRNQKTGEVILKLVKKTITPSRGELQ